MAQETKLNYQEFLFWNLSQCVHSGTKHPLNGMEYDEAFPLISKYYQDFLDSDFNDEEYSEYDAISKYFTYWEPKDTKYPRKCCVTGKGMSLGWYFEGLGGIEYVKEEDKAVEEIKTLMSKDVEFCKALGIITVKDLVDLHNSIALEIAFNHLGVYYTEWEVDEDDTWFDINGVEYTKCHKCNEVTKEGSFCDKCLTSL